MKKQKFYTSTAWKWFRKYNIIKWSYVRDGKAVCKCLTSGLIYELPDKRMHLGHYLKVYDGNSTNFATAFDEKNVFPQSERDNRYMGGRQDVAREKLVQIHGAKAIELLEIKKRNVCKLGKFEMDLIAKEYKEKYKKLSKRLGVDI